MAHSFDRRSFLKTASASALGLSVAGCAAAAGTTMASDAAPVGGGAGPSGSADPLYKISLAEWSLNRSLFGGELDHLDFAPTAQNEFGISAVEYVNQFFMDKAQDEAYLSQMKQRAEDAGVESLLIMCDGEGALGAPSEAERVQTVENHKKWVEAARFLGCHAIRVNAQSEGTRAEQRRRAADGLRRLCEFAEDYEIDVLVENHGGLSSDGAWLSAVIEQVDHPLAGTLPDFGNFEIEEGEEYDRYQGVRELMPQAKAVSAKSYDFNSEGSETTIDYERMMQIVLEHDYHGHVGIEYEGEQPAAEGIRATKALLERVRTQLAEEPAATGEDMGR